MPVKHFYVYILANHSRTLYVGVTSNLERRMYEHKNKTIEGFTSRYNIDRLMHLEATTDANAALTREKQIKGWSRGKKIALIESQNPEWEDLSETWFRQDSSLRSE
jgi:putative endonuclease